jgi:hypothetical protein
MLGHLVSNAFPEGMGHRPPDGLFHRLWRFLFGR